VTSACIQHIETALPGAPCSQTVVRDKMLALFAGDKRSQRLIRAVYGRSGIHTRHSVILDSGEETNEDRFLGAEARRKPPSTALRNGIYVRAASRLAVQAVRSLMLESCCDAASITHIITVSCTGFFAPGLDHVLLNEIHLSRDVRRYHIGFMGCFASFQAMQMAAAFCAQEPEARVLLVAVELCSLHSHLRAHNDDIVAGSIFADGAAAALIGRQPLAGKAGLCLHGFRSMVTEDSQQDMSWMLGDEGFEMVLSSYVPQVIETNIRAAVDPLLAAFDVGLEDIGIWAVHPGGRRILDKVNHGLDLAQGQLAASRKVLAATGNMSSATILFVLKNILGQPHAPEPNRIVALAFGPGLSIESGLLSLVRGD